MISRAVALAAGVISRAVALAAAVISRAVALAPVAPVALVALAAGCGGAAPAKAPPDGAERLRARLVEDHRELLERDAPLVAEKFRRMARSPFAYFRGTVALFFDEVAAAARGPEVALVGDAHPENLGAYRTPDGAVALEWNDFDAARYGPYELDLWRLAAGLILLARAAGLDDAAAREMAREAAAAWVAEVRALAADEPPTAIRAGAGWGAIVDDVLARAAAAGGGAVELEGEPLRDDEVALVARVLAAYPASLVRPAGPIAPVAFARRSKGISSYPNLRYHVRLEDGRVLEIKEVRRDRVEPVVAIRRRFQEREDVDPLLGWAVVGEQSFVVEETSPHEKRIDVERVARVVAWGAGREDLAGLARAAGRLLARGHARAPAADGRPGLAPLAAAIGDGEAVVATAVRTGERQAAATVASHATFVRLIERHGPRLGWSVSRTP